MDELNRAKNTCTRLIKEKKQAKEADGSPDLPQAIRDTVAQITEEKMKDLPVAQVCVWVFEFDCVCV